MNFPTSMPQLEKKKGKKKNRGKKKEMMMMTKKEVKKKSGTVVKASLNAIGVKSQTESRLH